SDGVWASLGDAVDSYFSPTTTGLQQQASSASPAHAASSQSVAGPHDQHIQFGDLPPVAAAIKAAAVCGKSNSSKAGDAQGPMQQPNVVLHLAIEAPGQRRLGVALPAHAESQERASLPTAEAFSDVSLGRGQNAALHDKQSPTTVLAERDPGAASSPSPARQGTSTYTPRAATRGIVISSRAPRTTITLLISAVDSRAGQQRVSATVAAKEISSSSATFRLPGSASMDLLQKTAPDKRGLLHARGTEARGRTTSKTLPGPTGPSPPTALTGAEVKQVWESRTIHKISLSAIYTPVAEADRGRFPPLPENSGVGTAQAVIVLEGGEERYSRKEDHNAGYVGVRHTHADGVGGSERETATRDPRMSSSAQAQSTSASVT
ncbi:hypothetical protein OC835_007804, partial [Tilletia horrida]